MEQVIRTNLPIVGRIQHGEKETLNGKTKVKELGYFIAKTKNENMNFLVNRFDEHNNKQTALEVYFFDDNPLTLRRIRYNQGGAVCYCMQNSTNAKQKVSNKWQDIKCTENCKYKTSEENTKPACNREGTLKFLLPKISQDRVWLMKITGQESINNLSEYINFQKYLGNQIKGYYTLFLTQKEQITSTGKKFKNYVLDIVKSEEFNSKIQNRTNNNLSLTNESKSQDISKKKETLKSNSNSNSNSNSKKSNAESVQNNNITNNQEKTNTENISPTLEDVLFLYDKSYRNFKKNGKETEYLVAHVTDVNDKVAEVIVSPEFREELEECDVGTELTMELEKFGENTISKSIKFIQKIPVNKKAVA